MSRKHIAIILGCVLGVATAVLVLVGVLHPFDGTARAQPSPQQDPTFSISRTSAQAPVPYDAADILTLSPGAVPPPIVAWPCAALGLGFCGGGDDLNSGSLGQDFILPRPDAGNPDAWLYFSVAPGSAGAGGTGVNNETVGCTNPEPEADEFGSAATGSNYQFFDGDGVASCSNPAAAPLGLLEPLGDDLDVVDPLRFTGPPAPVNPGFVTLDQASPSLPFGPGGPYSAADIFADAGAGFFVYASAIQLGLDGGGLNTDDIDALCLWDDGDQVYTPGVDIIWFSLAAGSMSLGANSAADIFAAPYTGQPVIYAAQLGLLPSDDLNALKCYQSPADLAKEDLYVKPFFCGDSDMDGDETGLHADPGFGTCCDGVDNDGDTTTDGRDPQCLPYTNEDAADGVDNDGDGWVDEDPLTYESGQTCPWNGDDDCDLVVDEDPKNDIDDDGDTKIDEDPANGFLGIDNDGDGWVDEDGAGRFDWDGDTAVDEDQIAGWDDEDDQDDDGDTSIDEDSLDSPVRVGEEPSAHQAHYLVKELLVNYGPGPIVLAEDIKEIDAPGARDGREEVRQETCNDGLDNDSGPCDDDRDNDRDGTCDWDGCDGMPPDSDCTVPADTEGDGLIDAEDPECLMPHVWQEAVGLNPCNDGLDNDGDGGADDLDHQCDTTSEASVEITDLAQEVSVGPGVSAYVKVRDPVHGNKCQPPKIPLDPPYAVGSYEIAASELRYNGGTPVAVGDCIAVDSKPEVVKELDLHQQVALSIDYEVLKEHQFDLACEDHTSSHRFIIQNQLQPPDGVEDPDPWNNALQMEMLVGCLAFTDGEAENLMVPASPWNVDVSTSYTQPVSVDASNNGTAPADFSMWLGEISPGLGIEGLDEDGDLLVDEDGGPPSGTWGTDDDGDTKIDEDPDGMPDSDGDGWADNVEATLGSNPGDPGSQPESMHGPPGSCSDGVDNDGYGFPGIDLADPKCQDADGDGHSDVSESILNSDPDDIASRPEHMQLPWTCGDGLDNDADGMEDGSGPVAPGDGDCNDGADNDGDCPGDTNGDTIVCGPGDDGVDGLDADCLPFIDTNEPDDDSNGYGDCTIDQLEGIRPPVTCASGWVPQDEDGDTTPDRERVHLYGDGSLVVYLIVPLQDLLGPLPTVTRDLVFHCFAPASPYPADTITAKIVTSWSHVFDLNATNDKPPNGTFSGNATCTLGEADLELIDWTFTPDVPAGFQVSQDHVYTTTKTIHNHGPTAADVRVQKTMNVPVNCDGSLHASYAGETVYVAKNTMYKMPPDVPDWTDSGSDGEELHPVVPQIVYVQGSTSLELEESELSAEFILPAAGVPVSVPVAVEEDFDIHCRQTGVQGVDDDSDTVVDEDPPDGADDDGDTQVDEDPAGYSFEFGNQIVPDLYPAVCDPFMGDLSKDVTKVVDVLPGGSDKQVLDIVFDQADSYPGAGSPLPIEPSLGQTFSLKPSTNVPFSVTSTDVNNGPTEPLDAEISFYGFVPGDDNNGDTLPDCEGRWYDAGLVTPPADFPLDIQTIDGDYNIPSDGIVYFPPDKEPGPRWLDLHFQTLEYGITEPVGVPVDFTRFFEIHCAAEGMYQFQFCNRADVKPPDTDPDPGNNLLCEPLWVLTPNAPGCPDTDGSVYDTWTSCQEQHMGTDYNDDCPDIVGDDALPPDFSMDKTVNILDVLMYKPKLPPNPYDKRYDLNTDYVVNILDVLLFKVELVKPWPCT